MKKKLKQDRQKDILATTARKKYLRLAKKLVTYLSAIV